jgi:integrase
MARPVKEARIQDRTARARLAPCKKPYWRQLSEGQHLGYYKGKRKGSWIVRRLSGHAQGTYITAPLGEADDVRPADGIAILDWKQAFEKALHWLELQDKGGESAPAADPSISVGKAASAYIAVRDARRTAQAGRTVHSDAHYKLGAHVLKDKALAAIMLAELTEADLKAWQLRRTARLDPQSLQRVANELKAALNAAWVEHRRVLPADLPVTIKYGLKVEAPAVLAAQARDNQILTDAQVRRIVTEARALDEDFGRLVLVLAATGARFAQARRLVVGDVQPEHGRIMVPESFKGKKRACQHIRVRLGADTLAALAPAIEDRPLSAPLLERWRHRQVSPTKWVPVSRGAWSTASEMSRMWRQCIANAGLPKAIIPYALRHSSIVRGLRMGLPIRLVAALHDTSVAMIERHYSRWITDGLDELAARAVVPLLEAA